MEAEPFALAVGPDLHEARVVPVLDLVVRALMDCVLDDVAAVVD